jgi:glucose-1-phosphate adenylyltransferase
VGCIDIPVADACGFGVIGVDASGRVTSFVEKPANPPPLPGRPDRALASMGIYVFNARFLDEQLVRDAGDPRSKHDFGQDIIPALIGRSRVFALPFRDACIGGSAANAEDVPYWRDVGTVDAYWEANMELARVTPALNLYDQAWPIWTYQEQLPPAKFVLDDDGRRGGAIDSLFSGGCIVSGGSVRRSVLFSNARVAEHSVVEDSVVLPGARIARNVVMRRAIVEEGCMVPEGLSVGVDPAHDAQRFRVSAGGVTLVTPAMLGQPRSAVV